MLYGRVFHRVGARAEKAMVEMKAIYSNLKGESHRSSTNLHRASADVP